MENILQVWPHFTCKQTPTESGKTFSEKYLTSKQMKRYKLKEISQYLMQG